MTIVWIVVLVLGLIAVVFGVALWRRASEKYSARTGEQWGPPSAAGYFLVIGGTMAAGIGGIFWALAATATP